MGNPAKIAKARWSSERNNEGHAAVDRCAHWRGGQLPICEPNQQRRHWAVVLFRETANLRTNVGVCLCLCVLSIDIGMDVHMFLSCLFGQYCDMSCIKYWNERFFSFQAWNCGQQQWDDSTSKVFERNTATLCGSEGLVVGWAAHWNGTKMRANWDH